MRNVSFALAIVLTVSTAARADGRHASDAFIDLFIDLATLTLEAATLENAVNAAPPPQQDGYLQSYDDPPPRTMRSGRPPQARQGLLLSLGLGGGSMYVSTENPTRSGAFDLDFRLGYGFSDRLQFFMDLSMDAGSFRNAAYASDDVASWSFTFRGQTVLIGDRAGNGLNLNLGAGLGGVTYNSGYYDETSSPAGLAVAGGISYDARVSPWFSLSPEFFYTWHAIPTVPGFHDVANIYGFRVNFLWYLH